MQYSAIQYNTRPDHTTTDMHACIPTYLPTYLACMPAYMHTYIHTECVIHSTQVVHNEYVMIMG